MPKIQRRTGPKRLRIKNSRTGAPRVEKRLDLVRIPGADEDFLTLREVAKWLRVAPSTVYRMVQREQLPAFRFGKNFRFRRADIEAAIPRATFAATEHRYKRRRVSRETPPAPRRVTVDAWLKDFEGST